MSTYHPERRRNQRALSILGVRCRVSQGFAPEVWLTDLSADGCHLVIRAGSLRQNQRVVIKADGIEGLPGIVKWVVEAHAGVEFDRPLHQAVVDHLLAGSTGSAEPVRDGHAPLARPYAPTPELPRRSPVPGNGRRPCL